ncbi:MAG: hypothetical protein DCF21_06285 [Leptolyngbya sp.]|jgi:uridine phosphorylase|uniref:Uncharacterized protein n=1 Tax=Shackletoniella antarctica TaxID=268115 RepID=A0A2W4Y9N8_9CYAN|nr:MAG: hypothetical protein DCF17_05505 [Shackletoniella antarctica]PZV19931.1 MAG: hypothetical protein DCF21_06285 [Leptolyngbya sp.]
MTTQSRFLDQLQVLNALYQRGYHSDIMERSLAKIIDLERSQALQQASDLQAQLQVYETRYQMSSDTFYQQFNAGELGDGMDFFEWSAFYDMWQSVQTRLGVLQSIGS